MTAIIIIGAIILVPLIYLTTLKGKYEVKRSIVIHKKAKIIFDKTCDFKTWNDWSPWIIHEPDTKMTYSKDYKKEGGSYTWEGKMVGAGKLSHIRLDSKKGEIEQKIEFTKPFRSVCRVFWKIQEQKRGTKVTWAMQGKMPFLFRFMTARTVGMIEKDYDFGLAMLNGILDSKAERPKLSFDGIIKLQEQTCLIKSHAGSFEELPSVMPKFFSELFQYIEKTKNLEISGIPFTAYLKMNQKKGTVKWEVCIPVIGSGEKKYKTKTYPAGKYLRSTLKGDYKFLGIAWHHSFNHFKMEKQKFDWRRACLELYPTNPSEIKNSNDYITEIYLPIR